MIDPEFRDVKTRSAISTLYNFTMRQSYVGALIIMMVSTVQYLRCVQNAITKNSRQGCKQLRGGTYSFEKI